jgi:CheY-like chemotaxis protein
MDLQVAPVRKAVSFLIVDDNSTMRRVIGHLVSEFADEVIECDDGKQALLAYARHQPEWVLMDVQMREKDGLAATREICAAYPKAKIVIVSNYGDEVTRAAANQAGAVAYILKENLLELRDLFAVKH